MAVIQEAWIGGVSTRRVDELAQAMGLSGINKSQVSKLCKDIDERVNAFLDRPLSGEWPYLWLDATYLKQREGGRIVSVAWALVLFVSRHRPQREPGRRAVQRAPGHGSRPSIFPLRQSGDRRDTRPGHDRRPRQLSSGDPDRVGQACAAPDQSLPEQPAGAGSSRHQRPISVHAGLQMPQISIPVLPGLRRTAQLPPLSLPPQPVRSRRLPQTPIPPPHRDGAGHPGSRVTGHRRTSESTGYTCWREP